MQSQRQSKPTRTEIISLIEESGKSQIQIAGMLGVNPRAIAAFTREDNPTSMPIPVFRLLLILVRGIPDYLKRIVDRSPRLKPGDSQFNEPNQNALNANRNYRFSKG